MALNHHLDYSKLPLNHRTSSMIKYLCDSTTYSCHLSSENPNFVKSKIFWHFFKKTKVTSKPESNGRNTHHSPLYQHSFGPFISSLKFFIIVLIALRMLDVWNRSISWYIYYFTKTNFELLKLYQISLICVKILTLTLHKSQRYALPCK